MGSRGMITQPITFTIISRSSPKPRRNDESSLWQAAKPNKIVHSAMRIEYFFILAGDTKT